MERAHLLAIPCAIYLCGLAVSKRRKVRVPYPLTNPGLSTEPFHTALKGETSPRCCYTCMRRVPHSSAEPLNNLVRLRIFSRDQRKRMQPHSTLTDPSLLYDAREMYVPTHIFRLARIHAFQLEYIVGPEYARYVLTSDKLFSFERGSTAVGNIINSRSLRIFDTFSPLDHESPATYGSDRRITIQGSQRFRPRRHYSPD